jgi:hypothetical protein
MLSDILLSVSVPNDTEHIDTQHNVTGQNAIHHKGTQHDDTEHNSMVYSAECRILPICVEC